MDTMLGDLDYATAHLDDILVTSKTTAEHRNHIINVFEKLQEYGFKVKEAKFDFFLPKIKYLGHVINRDGRRLDPERANEIRNIPAPDNVQALQSSLGQANFYQGFIKNMQNLREPLNELLKKDEPWLGTPECQESFEKIKKTLTSDLSLTHHDPTLDIIVASDASSFGIGACILHKLLIVREKLWHTLLDPCYQCYILTFDPAQKYYSKVIHRKEVTHSNGQ